LIEESRIRVAQVVNQDLTILYWEIGNRINNDLLDGKRATYDKQIVSQLATYLQNILYELRFLRFLS